MSYLVKKWSPTHLLEDADNKEEIASSLQEALDYLLDKKSDFENKELFEWASGLILPSIRRLYDQDFDDKNVENVDGKKFAKIFLKKADSYKKQSEMIDENHNVDSEAEISQMFVDWYSLNHFDNDK